MNKYQKIYERKQVKNWENPESLQELLTVSFKVAVFIILLIGYIYLLLPTFTQMVRLTSIDDYITIASFKSLAGRVKQVLELIELLFIIFSNQYKEILLVFSVIEFFMQMQLRRVQRLLLYLHPLVLFYWYLHVYRDSSRCIAMTVEIGKSSIS